MKILFILDIVVLCGAFRLAFRELATDRMIRARFEKRNMFCRDNVDCPRFYFCDRSIPFLARCERQTPSIPIPVVIYP